MTKKYLRNWIMVVASFVAMLTIVFATVYGAFDNVLAAPALTDVEKARRNVAVKVLAKNLEACYNNAKQTVDFNLDYSWKYDSDVYWTTPNMQVYYPKTLAGKTGSEASSNCAKMITGWKTNWIVKLFTDRGDFVGVDQDATVPGNYTDETAFVSESETMKEYLTGVGYSKTSASSDALDGYKCMYFTMSAYRSAFDNYMTGGVNLPASGSTDFISRETYCVPVDSDNNVDFDKVFRYYGESDDNDNAFDRYYSSRDQLSLCAGDSCMYQVLNKNNKKSFVATIDNVSTFYVMYLPALDTTRLEIVQMWVSNNDANLQNGCPDMLTHTSAVFKTKTYDCALTDLVDKQDNLPKMSFDTFKNNFKNYIQGLEVDSRRIFSSVTAWTLDPNKATAKFEKGNVSNFVNHFFDQSGRQIVASGYAMDTAEQYMFYYDHIKNYFGTGIYVYDNESDAADPVEVIWLDENSKTFSKKYVSLPSSVTKTACALSGNAWSGNCGSNEKDWRYFAEQLGKFTEEQLTTAFADISLLDQDYSDAVDNQIYGDNGGETCKTAAKSMGWLLCTILDGIGNGVQTLYDKFIEPSLRVEPTLFSNETTGAKQGWDVFRNVANVLIIILFLVVIFSQLTGVGIDNYGIKKILPKLILISILMNLSYYICEIGVDISNIVGSGIQTMFDGFAPTSEAAYQAVGFDAARAGSTLVSVALLGGAIGGFWAIGGFSLATLLALLPTAISVLVAIFFLFILLAAREAAIVVLVVLSPLAFACFILPNTKKLFDRWVKVSEALLLVYPIAGLLVAGGNYVSRVLLNSNFATDSFVRGLTAMLAGIIPIFFIPGVLKSSMNGLGGLGDKISNFGNRLGRGAASGVRGSEAFKNQQQRANERRLRKMAGLTKNEKGEWVDSNGLRSRFAKSGIGKALGADRNLARRRSQVEAMEHAKEMELGYNDMGVLNAQRVKDENMRVSRAAEGEAGVAALDADVALTQARNARMEQDANMAVGVPALNEDLAKQRAQARRSSQELRNYQDQYATFSKAQLSNASKNAFGANGWLRQQDGAQRMAALMGAMINNGMENDVYQLLRDDKDGDIAKNASVMQMLAGVKEKGLKAYGKKGLGVSYESFMKDLVDVLDSDGKPTGRRATLMQQYIDDKGNEFYNDLSDKTLKQIAAFDRDFGVQNMSTSQLFSAASRLQAQDAVNVVDEMLVKRAQQAAQAGTPLKFTGDQLASFSPSTVAELNKSAVGQQAIVEASQDLLRNPKLQSKVDAESRQIIDQLRGMTGQSEIWEPGEKIVRQRDTGALEGGGSIRQETVVSQEAASARAQQAAVAEAQPVAQPASVGDSAYAREVVMDAAGAAAQPIVGDASTSGPTVSPAPWATGTTGINELLNMVGPTKRSSDYGKLEDAILNYSGSDFAITPKQLDDMPVSTVQRLASSANTTHTQALLTATDGMTAEQFGRLNPVVKETLNSLRTRNGKPRL